jgi:hypothetical protein
LDLQRNPALGLKLMRTLSAAALYRIDSMDSGGREVGVEKIPRGIREELEPEIPRELLSKAHGLEMGLGAAIDGGDIVALSGEKVMKVVHLDEGDHIWHRRQLGTVVVFVLQGAVELVARDGRRVKECRAGQMMGYVLLAATREYSHWLASYWPPLENILTGWHPIGHH